MHGAHKNDLVLLSAVVKSSSKLRCRYGEERIEQLMLNIQDIILKSLLAVQKASSQWGGIVSIMPGTFDCHI